MKGLKLEPGWRQALVAWLNWLCAKSKPPTRARTWPGCESSETSAACASGHCAMRHSALGAASPVRITRMIAPRSIARSSGALRGAGEVQGLAAGEDGDDLLRVRMRDHRDAQVV